MDDGRHYFNFSNVEARFSAAFKLLKIVKILPDTLRARYTRALSHESNPCRSKDAAIAPQKLEEKAVIAQTFMERLKTRIRKCTGV